MFSSSESPIILNITSSQPEKIGSIWRYRKGNMKIVEIGARVHLHRLDVTGTVERIDADGFCWLRLDNFPGHLGLPARELKLNSMITLPSHLALIEKELTVS